MSGFRLEGISSIFRSHFSAEWLKKTVWTDNEQENEVILGKVFRRITGYEQEVLLRLGYSMLSGEYVVKQGIKEQIDDIIDALSVEFPAETDNKYNDIIVEKLQDTLEYTIFSLKRYKHFIDTIKNQYSPNEPVLALNAYSIKGDVTRLSEWHFLYDILFEIVEFDHRLSYDRRKMRELILHYSAMEEALRNGAIPAILREMVSAMKDKCFFLLKKLLIYDKAGVDYMVDFELKHVGVEDSSPKWLQSVENAFEFYRKNDTREERYGFYLESSSYNKQLRLSLYPLLMKYFKDLKSVSVIQLDHIIEEFDNLYSITQGDLPDWRLYDKYALKSIRSYLYNARFDYKLTSGIKYTYEDMLADLQSIEALQRETRIVDYYPYYKAATFISELLEEREKFNAETKREYLEEFNEILEKCSDALSICHSRGFYPIQSRYFDCLFPYEGFGPVFIPSSYCRPLQYDKIQARITKLKTKALFFENALRLDVEREEIESIKKGIDQSKKQTIEIISVFTAIITFLFGTIDFFSKSNDSSIPERVFSVVSLGLILLLFVSSVSIVTMRRELPWKLYWKEPRFIFFVVVSVFVALLLAFLVVKVAPIMLH